MSDRIYTLPEDLELVPAELLEIFENLPNKVDKYMTKELPNQISKNYMRKNNFCYYRCSKTNRFDVIQKMLYNVHTNTRYLRDEFI